MRREEEKRMRKTLRTPNSAHSRQVVGTNQRTLAFESGHRSALMALNAGVAVHDTAMRVIFVNPAFGRIHGLSENISGGSSPALPLLRTDGSLVPEEEHPVVLTARSREPLRNVPFLIRRENQEEVTHVLCNTVPLEKFWIGNQLHERVVVAMFIDVTAQRQADDNFSRTFEEVNVGMANLDEKGRFATANRCECFCNVILCSVLFCSVLSWSCLFLSSNCLSFDHRMFLFFFFLQNHVPNLWLPTC